MFITKKYIPRRTFLRGAGVALALPLLESMVPAQTPAAKVGAGPKQRFVGIFAPHGWAEGFWIPKTDNGQITEFGFIQTPLEPWRKQVTIVHGLDAKSSMPPPGASGGDHSRTAASFTGAAPRKTAGADISIGTSVDQLIAQKIGQETLLPSLQLAIEDPGANTGICGWGYSCAYSNSISWAAPNKPLPHEINPMVVFEHLFGDGSTPEERAARRETNASILDGVSTKVSRLQKMLPASDRARLGEYMDAVRELERRIQIAAKSSSAAPRLDIPFGVPESFDEHIKLHFDLQALAFQGDITRVSTLMYARDVSLRSYPESGVTTVNHSASHHGEDPKKKQEWAKINLYHQKCFAYFLKKLQSTKDGDSNLLDNTLILWASNMGNANQHSHVNVGHLLAGGAGGKHKGGKYVSAPGESTANLLLSTLKMFDVNRDSIGDSTGVLPV
jgi:hypothetical protein